MSRLTVFNDDQPGQPVLCSEDPGRVAAEPGRIGVRFERRESPVPASPQDPPETVPAACRPHPDRPHLDRLMGESGAGSADVIKLDQHTHTQDEVRLFVHGRVYDAHCTAGDLIAVPNGIRHRFDAGETPQVTALRVFTDTTGWVAPHTGGAISDRFPTA